MSLSRSTTRAIAGILAVCVISLGIKLYAQQSGGLTPPPQPVTSKSDMSGISQNVAAGSPLRIGERLAYNVSWASFPSAARVELEVVERGQFYGQDSYQISTRIETLGQVRSLFNQIDNQYTSYINTQTALPYRVIGAVQQGDKQGIETVILDHARQQAVFSDDSTLPIPAGTFDLPSLIYGLRLRALPEGSKQKVSALLGHDLLEAEAVVKKNERITTQTGTYDTICVKFYPQKSLSKYRAYVYFSNDELRLPVLITAQLPIGEIRAELTSATVSMRQMTPLAKMRPLTDESGAIATLVPAPTNAKNDAGKYVAGEMSLPFAIGERLNYEIAWGNFTSVGRASFEVRQQGMLGSNRVFELHAEATSIGAARRLITVNDQVSSFASLESLTPLRTDLRLREGSRFKQEIANFNGQDKSAVLSNGTIVKIPPGTHDMVSLFYAIRAADLTVGAIYDFPFLDANFRLQMVRVVVVKQEIIGTPLGNREALQIDILSPPPSQFLIAQAWISNDARHLPLYITTRTRFGELRFQITNAINTK